MKKFSRDEVYAPWLKRIKKKRYKPKSYAEQRFALKLLAMDKRKQNG